MKEQHMETTVLREYVRLALDKVSRQAKRIDEAAEQLDHPLASNPEFVFSRKRSKNTYQYETSLDSTDIKTALRQMYPGTSVKLYANGEPPNPSSSNPMYSVVKRGEVLYNIVVAEPKNILTDGVIAVLAERAVLHAINGTGTFAQAVSEESTGSSELGGNRLTAIKRSKDRKSLSNLKDLYDHLKGLAEHAIKDKLKIAGSAEIPKSTTAKVDIVTDNVDIHVKYNDVTRLIGIQDVKKSKDKGAPAKSNDSSLEKIKQAASAAEATNSELVGNSTTLFRTLRRDFVRTLKVPGRKVTFGDLNKEDPMQAMASMKGVESKLLYGDPVIRSSFQKFLEANGYVQKLTEDIQKFIEDASREYDPKVKGSKSTYFFVFKGKAPDSNGDIDPYSLSLDLKQMKVPDASSVRKGSSRIAVIPQVERNNVKLYNVTLDGVPVMTVEFRSIDGGGHPPQLHLLRDVESGLFAVDSYEYR